MSPALWQVWTVDATETGKALGARAPYPLFVTGIRLAPCGRTVGEEFRWQLPDLRGNSGDHEDFDLTGAEITPAALAILREQRHPITLEASR